MSNNLQEPQPQKSLEPAQVADNVPQIYANGFEINLGAGDVHLVLKRRGEDVAIIDMSYTLAKTLSEFMGKMVAFLEQTTGNTIMTTEFIDGKLKDAKYPGRDA